METRQLGLPADTPYAPPRETGPLDSDLGAPWVVELQVHSTPLTLRVGLNQQIILGRQDATTGTYPDLDLSPYEGLRMGVSRQHAAVRAEADRLLLIDLHSTNGTYVNGQRLQPEQPYRLRHGDEIHLGHVRVDIRLVVVPIHQAAHREQPWIRLADLPQRGKGQRLMLAMPNSDAADALASILTAAGYTVYPVQTQATAIGAVTHYQPNVVVLDMDAGPIKGLDLCHYIRQMTAVNRAAIIALSTETAPADLKAILAADVDVVLGKPVGVDELLRAIHSATQQTRPLRSIDPATVERRWR
jgi:CheY-like chemotaxis protein